jgi:hypothetical protein
MGNGVFSRASGERRRDFVLRFFKENGHPDRQNPIFFLVGSQSSRRLAALDRPAARMLNEETLDLRILLYHMILLHLLGSGVVTTLRDIA